MAVHVAGITLSETDRAWFGEGVEVLLPALYGAALRLCGEASDAEDLVAETLAKAWQSLPALQDRGAFRSWVFRILNNTFVSQCRAARTRPEQESLDRLTEESFSLFERLHQPILLWWGNPELEFLNHLLQEDLERAIGALPTPYRTVVAMVDVQGLSYRDVTEVLGIPIGTVRSRLARGRGLLQRALWAHALDAGLAQDLPHPERATKQ